MSKLWDCVFVAFVWLRVRVKRWVEGKSIVSNILSISNQSESAYKIYYYLHAHAHCTFHHIQVIRNTLIAISVEALQDEQREQREKLTKKRNFEVLFYSNIKNLLRWTRFNGCCCCCRFLLHWLSFRICFQPFHFFLGSQCFLMQNL